MSSELITSILRLSWQINFSCRHPTCFSNRLQETTLLQIVFYGRRWDGSGFVEKIHFSIPVFGRESGGTVYRLRRTRQRSCYTCLAQFRWTAALFRDEFCFRNTIITSFSKHIFSTLSNCFKCPDPTFDLSFGSFQTSHFTESMIFSPSVANFFSYP